MPKRRMRKRGGAKQTIYIDSCFIDDYLWGNGHDKRHAGSVFRKIGNTLSNPNIKPIMPFVSVGEIVNTMIQKGKEEKFEEMIKLIKDLKVDTPPPNKAVIEISHRILNDDDRFDPTDAIIAAHALCDEYSVRLLTKDKITLFSIVLEKLEKELEGCGKRRSKLRISDKF